MKADSDFGSFPVQMGQPVEQAGLNVVGLIVALECVDHRGLASHGLEHMIAQPEQDHPARSARVGPMATRRSEVGPGGESDGGHRVLPGARHRTWVFDVGVGLRVGQTGDRSVTG